MMNILRPFFIWLLLVLPLAASMAQIIPKDEIIKRPENPRMAVNDFTGVLSSSEKNALELKIRAFQDTSATSPLVVIVNTVAPYEIDQYAYSIGQHWGLGNNTKEDNGVVLLVAVKDRKVFIATGYGVEGALPDATAKLIVENDIIPAFKQGNYPAGINAGIDGIIAATAGEYSKAPTSRRQKQQPDNGFGGNWLFLLMLFFFFIILPIMRARKYQNKQVGGNKRGGLGWLATLLLMNQMGNRRGRDWDDFRGGGGIFGGGGGGGGGFGNYGGFGGGDFGGGGAGGSW